MGRPGSWGIDRLWGRGEGCRWYAGIFLAGWPTLSLLSCHHLYVVLCLCASLWALEGLAMAWDTCQYTKKKVQSDLLSVGKKKNPFYSQLLNCIAISIYVTAGNSCLLICFVIDILTELGYPLFMRQYPAGSTSNNNVIRVFRALNNLNININIAFISAHSNVGSLEDSSFLVSFVSCFLHPACSIAQVLQENAYQSLFYWIEDGSHWLGRRCVPTHWLYGYDSCNFPPPCFSFLLPTSQW